MNWAAAVLGLLAALISGVAYFWVVRRSEVRQREIRVRLEHDLIREYLSREPNPAKARDGDATAEPSPPSSGGGSSSEVLGLGSRSRADAQRPDPGSEYSQLLVEYYSQGLAQSATSFRVSLIAAGLGFLLILGSAVMAFFGRVGVSAVTFGVIGGAITDAVAALFFVQANRSRKLMQSMHSRLRKDDRSDRQYYKALQLVEEISSGDAKDELKAQFARHFVNMPGPTGDATEEPGPNSRLKG